MVKTGTQFFAQDLVAYLLPGHLAGFSLLDFPLNRWMMVWIPAFGGVISGFLVFRFAPEAEGHGTDAMIDSFHRKKGIVRKHVPAIKTIASAITIGSGGSAGKEGPIAQIGSGFGSILASLLKLSDKECRIMLLAGAAEVCLPRPFSSGPCWGGFYGQVCGRMSPEHTVRKWKGPHVLFIFCG